MTAIVMNTMTGAVTEYSGFDFQSITPDYAGSALGLYELGGDRDGTAPIVASLMTGKTLFNDTRRKYPRTVYFAMKGTGISQLVVQTETDSFTYDFPVRENGLSRAVPGRGIRENYLAFGYTNPDGEDFQIDRIELLTHEADTRRV